MTDKNLSIQTVDSLARKLDEFAEVLTAEEHSVLLGLIGMASATMEQAQSGYDTEAFATEKSVVQVPSAGKPPALSVGIKDAFKAVGGVGDPGGTISDSIGVGVTCVSWSKDYKEAPRMREDLVRIKGLQQRR